MTSRASFCLLLAACLSFALPAHAAYDAYLKVEGVPGESRDPGHIGWIEIGSVQLDQVRNSMSVRGATGGAGSGKVHFNEFTITKRTDAASPKLFEAATKGKHFPTATIEMRKAGGGQQEYLVFKLENVFVSSYRAAGPGGGLEESMTLNFTGATVENPSGSPRAGAAAHLSARAATGAVLSMSRTITKVTPSTASATTGQVITFSVEGTGSCDRSAIDFGDGTVVGIPFVSGKSTPAPTHAYAKAGNFEVRVWGHGDPWARLNAAPLPSEVVCSGHATANVAIRQRLTAAPAVAPAVRK